MTETRSPIPLRCAPAIDDQRRLVARLQSQLAQADAIARTAAAQLSEIERLPQRLLAQAFDPVHPSTSSGRTDAEISDD